MKILYLDKKFVTLQWIKDKKICLQGIENSLIGRKELVAACPPEITNDVLSVWGDIPEFNEDDHTENILPVTPSLEERTMATENAIIAIMAMIGGNESV